MRFPFWKKPKLSRARLPLAAFTVGAAVMAIEMTAARLLAPYFGASIIVWSSLILVVLLALSFGYWLGGRLAAKHQPASVLSILMLSAALLQVFGARVAGLVASQVAGTLLIWSQVSWGLMLGSALTAAITLAVPMIALGSMSPVVIELWAKEQDVARASSGYLLLSTLGGAFGTLAPTLWLVPTIGSQRTIAVFALALFGCGLLFLPPLRGFFRRRHLIGLGLLLLVFLLVGDVAGSQRALATQESAYQQIRVVQLDEQTKGLVFNEGSGIQSVSSRLGEPVGNYADSFALMPALRPEWPADHEVLILGLAAGTVVNGYRLLDPSAPVRFTGVEIDPAVVTMAEEHFGLAELPVETVIADGRQYLAQTDRQFASIIVDAYSVQLYIAPHLSSQEFWELVRTRLEPTGIAALNLNASGPEAPLFQAMGNTLASVFPHVLAVPHHGSWNWTIFLSEAPLAPDALAYRLAEEQPALAANLAAAVPIRFRPAEPVLTDDWAPVEFMTEAMIVQAALEEARKTP
jgi:spermidine synthase